MSYLQIQQKYAYQGISACRIHICDENSSKSYDFREKCKENQKFSNFCEYQLYRKVIAFDNIGGNYALSANSTKICLLGYFCMQNSYLQ